MLKELCIASACFVSLAGGALAQATSNAADQCVSVYAKAVSRVHTNQQASVVIHTIANNTCKLSNFNLTAGFDSTSNTLIKSVPVVNTLVGKLGISNNKQFCEAYNSGKLNVSGSDTLTLEPVVRAMEQFNVCMKIARENGVIITHQEVSPSKLMFLVEFLGTERPLNFTGMSDGGFECVAPRPDSSEVDVVGVKTIQRTRNFSVHCERPPKAVDGNLEFEYGAVGLATSAGIYTAWVPENALYGPYSRRAAERALAASATELADKMAELDRLKQQYAKRKVTTHPFYFGQYEQPGALGPRFGCGWWSHRPQSHWEPMIKEKFCPKGKIISLEKHRSHRGNRCGYNYFTLTCEELGRVSSYN